MPRVSGSNERYKLLVWIISHETRYLKALANVVTTNEAESLSRSLVRIVSTTNSVLPALFSILQYEFDFGKDSPTTLFRINSLATKVLGFWTRDIGRGFMEELLVEPLNEILSLDDSFELNPAKLEGLEGEEAVEEQIRKNEKALVGWTRSFLMRLTSEEFKKKIPPQFRLIGSWIYSMSKEHEIDPAPLLGGFIFLRFINPAIVTPETYNLVLERKIDMEKRRKLIMLTKILQNLANGIDFRKEEYMKRLNPFLNEMIGYVSSYLDFLRYPPEEMLIRTEPPFESFEEVDLRLFNVKDLVEIHSLLFDHAKEMLSFLETDALRADQTGSTAMTYDRQFIDLIETLGPPPKSKRLKGMTTESVVMRDTLVEHSYKGLKSLAVDTSLPSRSDYFFEGGPNMKGYPVFYLITSRIKLEDLETPDVMSMRLIHIFGDAVEKPYDLVVDLSWALVSQGQGRSLVKCVQRILQVFSPHHRKNLASLYLVHPSTFAKTFVWLAKIFGSPHLKKKVQEVYDWRELEEFIELDNIALPSESRHFIAKSFLVTKVNSRGKKQQRLIKLTPLSILNVDPKTRCIKNERLLSEIEELGTDEDKMEISMRFNPLAEPPATVGFFPCSHSEMSDFLSRKYICTGPTEMEALLDDILGVSMKTSYVIYPQGFYVEELSESATLKERWILKLTIDSILFVDKSAIRREVHLCGVEYVKLDRAATKIVLLKLRGEINEHRLACSCPEDLVDALEDGIRRFMREVEQSSEDVQVTLTDFLEFER